MGDRPENVRMRKAEGVPARPPPEKRAEAKVFVRRRLDGLREECAFAAEFYGHFVMKRRHGCRKSFEAIFLFHSLLARRVRK